jgi:exonuclease VII large subunit
VVERGFALVHPRDGQLVRSVRQVQAGDALQLMVADGRINTLVKNTEPDDHG